MPLSEESAFVPAGHRPNHIRAGQLKRPNGHVLSVLYLDDDAGAQGVLARGVELDSLPRHDQLVAADVGFGERLSHRFRLRRTSAVDRLGPGVEPCKRARRIAVEIRLETLEVDVIDLLDQRIARGEVQRPNLARKDVIPRLPQSPEEFRVVEAGIVRQDCLGREPKLLVALDREDGVAEVRGLHQQVRAGGLETLNFRSELSAFRWIDDRFDDVVTLLLGQLLLQLGRLGAPKSVLVHQGDALWLDAFLFLQRFEKYKKIAHKELVVRSGAEKPLEVALGERRRRGVRIEERHPVALRYLARGGGDVALIATDQRHHFFLGDQALGLGSADLRIALMVAEHQPNLRAYEAWQAGLARQWEIQALGAVVDHLGGELQGVLELQAGRGGGAGERVDCADLDF